MDFRSVGDTAGGSRTCYIAAYYVAYDVTALSRETLDRARLVRRWPKEQLQASVLLIMTCQILPGVSDIGVKIEINL